MEILKQYMTQNFTCSPEIPWEQFHGTSWVTVLQQLMQSTDLGSLQSSAHNGGEHLLHEWPKLFAVLVV